MAWARVQSKSKLQTTSATTTVVTLDGAPVTGNKIIVSIGLSNGNSGIGVSTVKDSNANSLTLVAGPATNTSNCRTWIYAYDVPATPSTAITVTWSAAVVDSGVVAQEISGLLAGNTTAMVDGTPTTKVGSFVGTASAGSATYSSAAANEFLISVFGDFGNSATMGTPSGTTLDANSVNTNANADCVVAYKNSTGGAETVTWTATSNSGTDQYALVLGAFKLAAGGALTINVSDSTSTSESVTVQIPSSALTVNVSDTAHTAETVAAVEPNALQVSKSDATSLTESVSASISGAGSEPTLIQATASGVQAGASNTTAVAFGSNVTAGNLLVAILGWVAGGTPLTDFTDSQGNTWTTINAAYNDANTGYTLAMGYALAGSSAANTVTAVLPEPGGSFRRLFIHEVAGADTYDTSITANSGASSASSLSQNITLAESDEIVIAAPIWNSAAGSPGSGWTIAAGSGADEFSEYQAFASAGVQAVTSTTTVSDLWMLIAAAFYAAGGVSTLSVNASDSTTVSETVAVQIPSGTARTVSVSDAVSTSETILVSIAPSITDALTISVSDGASTSETVTASMGSLTINDSESVSTSELIGRLETSFVNLSDSTSVTETRTVAPLLLGANASDSTSISETVTVTRVSGNTLTVNVTDAVSISENITASVGTLKIAVSDATSVTENRAVSFGFVPNINLPAKLAIASNATKLTIKADPTTLAINPATATGVISPEQVKFSIKPDPTKFAINPEATSHAVDGDAT